MGKNFIGQRPKQGQNKIAGSFEAFVLVNCANQRFKCATQQGVTVTASTLQFTPSQAQGLAQPQAAGHIGQTLGTHQGGAHSGHFAFAHFRKMVINPGPNHKIEHRVA